MNIAHNEDSSIDITVSLLPNEQYLFEVRLNEDIIGNTFICYTLHCDELEDFITYLTRSLRSTEKA